MALERQCRKFGRPGSRRKDAMLGGDIARIVHQHARGATPSGDMHRIGHQHVTDTAVLAVLKMMKFRVFDKLSFDGKSKPGKSPR